MLPIHRLVEHLPAVIAVEDERRQVAIDPRTHQHAPGDSARQQTAGQHATLHRSLHRAVTHDQRDRGRKRIRHRSRERVTSAGSERHVDAARHDGLDGLEILGGQAAPAIEQRAVDVDGEKTNHLERVCRTIMHQRAMIDDPRLRYHGWRDAIVALRHGHGRVRASRLGRLTVDVQNRHHSNRSFRRGPGPRPGPRHTTGCCGRT